MKITIVLSLTALVLFLSCGAVYAEEANIGESRIHPAHPLYFLKTIRENFETKLALSYRVKMFRQLEFATRRLRETKTLITINQDLIPPTLEKYNAHLNRLPDKDLKNEEILTNVKNSLAIHSGILLKMYDQVSNLRAKMSIRVTLNRIIQKGNLANSAKLPVCNFFANEASSSALNDTEKVVLLDRAGNCFKSLKVF